MADKFRTGDEPLTGLVSLRLTMPSALWFRQEFLDLLHDMTEVSHWDEVGSVTVDDATQAAVSVYWSVSTMVGEIVAYATSSPPDNVLECDGTYYLRADYPALYAALDSHFIVDADYFFVPDIRGRYVIGVGQGVGLSIRGMGDMDGYERVTLSTDEIPSHTHTDSGHVHSTHTHSVVPVLGPGEVPAATPGFPAEATSSGNAAIGAAGGGESHLNMPPYYGLKYGIVAW